MDPIIIDGHIDPAVDNDPRMEKDVVPASVDTSLDPKLSMVDMRLTYPPIIGMYSSSSPALISDLGLLLPSS